MAARRSSGEPGMPAGRRMRFREGLALVIATLLLVFALVNLENVTVDLIFAELTMPVFFVIVVPALLGFGVGILFQRRRA